ncbi:universal stress protein [Dyadobacter sp. NIV53]|uniref:universal stress protein n=1 Tax=Dyadobacter sp. NIV53 TaxID=2861765 RepID=UPI001C87A722|nr:universal stress protein [Dyadobacter sp. NIV53]
MKKILVPFDFSFSAREAYKFALDIAVANSGEILVLKVIEPAIVYGNGMPGQPYSYPDPVLYSGELTEDLSKEFDEIKESFDKPLVPVYFSVESGDITDTILRTIQEKEIDLVVMGTTGASGMKEFLIGSNTEKIVRFSSVPVLAVHKAQPLSAIKKIVFPTTFDLDQHALVNGIKALQNSLNAELYLLYVSTPASPFSDKEAMVNLENFAKFYSLHDYKLNIYHHHHEQHGILAFAKGLEHSIIAMATHGNKGITHLLFGSIAEDVVNHAKAQVWTYAIGHED